MSEEFIDLSNVGPQIGSMRAEVEAIAEKRSELLAKLGESLYPVTRDDERLREGREDLLDGIAELDERSRVITAGIDAKLKAVAEERAAREATVAEAKAVAERAAAEAREAERRAVEAEAAAKEAAAAQAQAEAATADDSETTGVIAALLVCPVCGGRVEADDVFCMSCGARLAESGSAGDVAAPESPAGCCPSCGSPVNPGDLFCMNCGQRLG